MDNDEPIIQYGSVWGNDEAIKIADVLEGENLIEGPRVSEFEEKFAKFVGAKYCVLMPNPTLALYAALTVARGKIMSQYLRIPNFGYIEIFNATIMAGYNPILCDVDETGVLKLRDNEAGVAVHYNGRKAKPTILEVCFDVPDFHTKGLMSVYDFNYERHITLGGKGGAVCTDDGDEYNNLIRFKDQGRLEENSPNFDRWGIDLQVTELQAAFGLAQLDTLEKKLDTIRANYKKIKEELKDNVNFVFLDGTPSMITDIYTKDPIKLGKFLYDNDIISNRLPKPLHMQTICNNAQRMDKNFNLSNTLYNAGLLLPSSPIMEDKQVDKIISALQKYTGN